MSRAAATATPRVRSIAAAPTAVVSRPAPLAAAARFFSQTARAASSDEIAREIAGENASENAAAADAPSEAASPAASETAAGAEPATGETPYGIFVRNIVFDASDEHLGEAFEHYGRVTRASISRDARGLSRGYGFIYFDNETSRNRALQEANGSFWHGRRLAVLPRTSRRMRENSPNSGARAGRASGSRDPTESLYIGNLPYETTDADLNTLFSELEGVTSVRVAVDRATGWPRGFAHADFESVQLAEAAFNNLRGKKLGTRELRVDYADPAMKGKEAAPRDQGASVPEYGGQQ